MTATLTKALYTATATAEGGREGRVASEDGRLDVTVSVPRELGGPGRGTNPEQLFAAGYAACFHSALAVVARMERVDLTGSTVSARVVLGPVADAPGYGLAVTLTVTLPRVDPEDAAELVQRADAVCPYSQAVRGNVAVTHQVHAA